MESSLQAAAGTPRTFLMGNMGPAPAEKKFQMYSKVRGRMQRGMKAGRVLEGRLGRSVDALCTCTRSYLHPNLASRKGLPAGEVITHWRCWRPHLPPRADVNKPDDFTYAHTHASTTTYWAHAACWIVALCRTSTWRAAWAASSLAARPTRQSPRWMWSSATCRWGRLQGSCRCAVARRQSHVSMQGACNICRRLAGRQGTAALGTRSF